MKGMFKVLNIVTNRNKDIQDLNDDFFDLHTCMEEITEKDKQCIKDIDGSDYITSDKIITRFGETQIEHISTGCKTMLNILHYPNTVFNVVECGDNVIDKLFELAKCNTEYTIYSQNMILPSNLTLEHSIKINGKEFDSIKDIIDWWDNNER